MVPMRVVQVAVDQVVDVIPMRYRLVTASRSVLVPRLVPRAAMLRRAAVGILGRHLDHVLVDMIAVGMMQVPIVKIVDVLAVLDGLVPAIGAVLVRMIGVLWVRACGHR
jgi:hypothetical protein